MKKKLRNEYNYKIIDFINKLVKRLIVIKFETNK